MKEGSTIRHLLFGYKNTPNVFYKNKAREGLTLFEIRKQ